MKKRLVKVLKTFEIYKQNHKKKEKFTLKLDNAARIIQRYWRFKKSLILQKDTSKATHRYIKEKL